MGLAGKFYRRASGEKSSVMCATGESNPRARGRWIRRHGKLYPWGQILSFRVLASESWKSWIPAYQVRSNASATSCCFAHCGFWTALQPGYIATPRLPGCEVTDPSRIVTFAMLALSRWKRFELLKWMTTRLQKKPDSTSDRSRTSRQGSEEVETKGIMSKTVTHGASELRPPLSPSPFRDGPACRRKRKPTRAY